MDPRKLESLEGRIVRATFDDGEESEVRVVSVDCDDHLDFTFEVVRVLKPGPRSDRPGNSFYVAPIASVVAAVEVEPPSGRGDDVPSRTS
jgi:hypothetical protein